MIWNLILGVIVIDKKTTGQSNAGMVEMERVISSLYAKRLIDKSHIKELINSLKQLVEQLPDHSDTYLH